MSSGKDSKKSRIEAVVIVLLFIGTSLIVPMSTIAKNTGVATQSPLKNYYSPDDNNGTFILDRSYYLQDSNPAAIGATDNDDAGYKRDAGNSLSQSLALYPGELIDETPGRGQYGKLTASSDTQDWFFFSVCQGQQIAITMTPPDSFNFDLSLSDSAGNVLASSTNPGSTPESITFTATYTGKYYMDIFFVSGTGQGRYHFTVTINGQNDANSGTDAGNTLATALPITPGSYFGYLDMNDPYDFYQFQVDQGKGIHLILKMKDLSYLTDFDLQLYDPSGKLVYEGNNYYDDDIQYPATVGGIWSTRVDIFPGWVDCPHPTNWSYYSYGSGPYNLTLKIESTAPSVPAPIPEPQITPIAKTFNIANDPNSNKDDFAYLAAIPACNYLDNGKRYLAPIIYTGDNTATAYWDDNTSFGTVDNTTQYLVNDWNTYLGTYQKTPVQYTVPADPIQAAADIATHGWSSSQTAVVAVDGSSFNDTTKTVLKKTATLKREVSVQNVSGDSTKIEKIGGSYGYPMFLAPKWCAVNVSMFGTGGATPTFGAIIPLFITMSQDWWPSPYDSDGKKIDIYHPVDKPGVWVAGTDKVSASWHYQITMYAGDRYHVKVKSADSVITAKITTAQPSDLLVFLINPDGYLTAPELPRWNGPVNPIHVWNGLENPPVNPWRTWNPGLHTDFTAEELHPEAGTWTIIVVPRNADSSSVKYTLTTTIRTTNADRADATISAANAAVIASANHYPLLYVTKTSVPAATVSALSTLGVQKVIFVERNNIGAGVRSSLPTIEKDLTTMQQIVNEIKSYSATEDYITLTSLKTGDGFFAPAAMLAAYHVAPVLRIEDIPGDPAAVAKRIHAWENWDGDYYHGSLSTGHLPDASVPVEQNKFKVYMTLIKFMLGKTVTVPTYGLDAKLNWNKDMVQSIQAYVKSLNLDEPGQEGYAVVAPRTDLPLEVHSALMGNNSYAGDIPGHTPAYSNDIIVRDILYPALIYANPGRNTTLAQMMNFPDGGTWICNNHKSYPAFSSRVVKNAFSSHLRTFEGHTFWVAHLQAINQGASVMYYSGHGTGGSGMSGMYQQSNKSVYPNQIWWDSWRGYMYDAWKMPRENGMIWFNPEPPELYDIVHYKWVDQLLTNLHSNAIFYMSCTTGDGDCPLVYLDHGAISWYGNAGTGLCPEADLADDNFFNDVMINGISIGKAFSTQVWLHYRDFTTCDNTSIYGPSSMQVTTIQVIYGDPNLVIYSPEWTSPIPVNAY